MLAYVSVIIPTYNDNKRLAQCLEALGKQTYPQEKCEIIVVDNGSDVSPADLVAKYKNARLVHEEKAGSYTARNKGIAVAKGDIFAFTDADCIPDTTWLENGVVHIEADDDVCVIGGRTDIFYSHPSKPTSVELYEKLYAFPTERNIRLHHYAPTCNLFTTRATIDAIGLFNDTLKSGGDLEWGQRAYNAGVALQYADDAIVKHPARSTWAQLAKKVRRVAGGQVDSALQSSRPVWKQRLLYYDFFPPISSLGRLLKTTDFKLQEKMKILGVIAVSRVVAIREKTALLLWEKDRQR